MTTQHTFYDHATEQALLGALLLEPEKIDDLGDLQAADFHKAAHGLILDAMRQIHAGAGEFNDLGRLQSELDASGHLGDVGGIIYLSELLDLRPSPHNIQAHARKLHDLAGRRLLWSTLQAAMVDLQNDRYTGVEADIVRDDIVRALHANIKTPLDIEGKKTVWTIAELLDAEFPEPRWAIPGILPVGLAFLAGRPKVGKSFLALQLAHAVGTGGVLFGRQIERGRVLFLALEDGERRLQDRVKKHQIERNADITLVQDWPTFGEGGIAKLHDTITKHGYTLTIVDTLSRAAGKADQLDLTQMTNLMGELQKVTQSTDSTILANDHHTKASGYSPNPVNDLMGSTGKAAVADVLMGLYKEQGRKGATLMVVGRDVEEQELVLLWDGQTCCWQLQGEKGGVLAETVQSDVLDAIKALDKAGKLPYGAAIAGYLEKDRAQVNKELLDLENKGVIVRGKKKGNKVPFYPADVP